MASISKRHIEFYNTFCEVENICRAKLGVASDGVKSYINRLKSTRYALNREEVLKRLARYNSAAAFIGHEGGSEECIVGICKADIKWLKRFKRSLVKKQDTLSRYLRRAKASKGRRIFVVIISVILLLVAITCGGYVAYIFGLYDKMTEIFGMAGEFFTNLFTKIYDVFKGLFAKV